MFQSFSVQTSPKMIDPRVQQLRDILRARGFDGFLIPHADAHQGENVAARDERLAWISGFTGSAGFAIVTLKHAALFVDGRYTLQAPAQTDCSIFDIHQIPKIKAADWLTEKLENGTLAYDPWLHSSAEIAKLEDAGIALCPTENLIDAIWTDKPPAPLAPIYEWDEAIAGLSRDEKRRATASALGNRQADAAVLTLPDSIAWLLNIRGGDIARSPYPHGFGILYANGEMHLFGMEEKADKALQNALGPQVKFFSSDRLLPCVAALRGRICLDRESCPMAIVAALRDAEIDWHEPVLLPKARKTQAEVAATRKAHLRDGAAFAEFLCWLHKTAPEGQLTEIDVVKALEQQRSATGALVDIAFETICGAGPNGAIVHYRVSEETNRTILPGELLLIDSGGQYLDGTTDITRTVAIGQADPNAKRPFTNVLKGMIAISRARWPEGLAGRDLDALARLALWQDGQDYGHGTGHGVGVFLGVHEGPQRLSRSSDVVLEAGMILSNEPGYYREGAFGIRIENLIVVTAPQMPEGGDLSMHGFETLTLAPIDRQLIMLNVLTSDERAWIDAYHKRVFQALAPLVSEETGKWLEAVCAPL